MSTALSIISQYVATDKEFAALPQRQRDRVYQWGYALADYYAATDKSKMIRYDTMARSLGYTSRTTVITKIKEWEATHDWRVLIDKRDRNNKINAHKGCRSARFRAWVIFMAEQECRTDKAALDKIHMLFMYGGTIIPGYEDHVPGSIPKGCSERHLRRIIADHRKEIQRARFGIGSVKEMPVLKSRELVEVGQFYELDDVMHDSEVLWNGESVRVAELGALDYASYCRFKWGHIPRFTRMDDKKRQGLDRKMALMFIAYILRYVGYHPEKCILMMEHKTTTLSEDKIRLLETATGGVLQIRMGGIKGEQQKKLGGYTARGKGNPMAKGSIEGSHSLLHNSQGNLPLQVGWTGRNEPATTYKMRKEVEQVAYWQQQLLDKGRTDLAAAIDMPTMTFHQFSEYLTIKYAIINGRTDHNIDGWSRNTIVEYNVAQGVWVSGAELEQNPEQKQLMKLLVSARPDMVRERKLSPTEVWEAGKRKLVKLPLSVYVDLIGDDRDFGRTVTVRDGLIRVQDKMIANGESLIYEAIACQDGEQPLRLRDNHKYRVVMNPYAPEELIIFDDSGRILGAAPQYVKVSPLDDALYKQIGKVEARKAQDMARQKARWEPVNNHVAARREHNRSLAEEGGVAPRRRSSADRVQTRGRRLPDSTYTPTQTATADQPKRRSLPNADTRSYGSY